jgi:hypothetical protein
LDGRKSDCCWNRPNPIDGNGISTTDDFVLSVSLILLLAEHTNELFV